jgi:hypothetical protein
MRWLALLFVFPLAGCGGDLFVNDDDGGDAATDSPTSDVTPQPDASPIECGKSICSGDQVCVHPCCGGALVCEPEDDGGACPQGLTPSTTCPLDTPCSYVCVPDPPYCGPSTQCPEVQGHDCYLVCG